ncbi:MAG: glutaredoxin family protein [Candidatus Thiodiazotropha lotti]|nr:glutaredoxin family protein [Candidatus Thiodiazotropha lotti]
MIELKFYHRQGCHLCDEMWDELSAVDGVEKIVLMKVDIDRDSELKTEYGLRIPCLEGPDGISLSEHYLDQSRLLSYLRDV